MNPYTLLVIGLVIGGIWVLREAGRMNPKQARKFGIRVGGWGVMAVGALFCLTGRFEPGLGALGIGAAMLGYGNLSKLGFPGSNQSPASAQGPMDRAEAYEVLGLKSGASRDEINAAFKRLQRANHPDTGGSTYLAAKINQARDLLLGS